MCFGKGANGRLGTDSTMGIADGSANLLSTRALISFSDSTLTASISTFDNGTCVVRADGALYCFGSGGNGQLGSGGISNLGDGPGTLSSMTALPFIAFKPTAIPRVPPGMIALITSLMDSVGIIPWYFSPVVTSYVLSAPADVTSFSISTINTVPPDATISMNGALAPTSLPFTSVQNLVVGFRFHLYYIHIQTHIYRYSFFAFFACEKENVKASE